MKKNIHEEINRIKSLFTEERLYGNLITESDDKLLGYIQKIENLQRELDKISNPARRQDQIDIITKTLNIAKKYIKSNNITVDPTLKSKLTTIEKFSSELTGIMNEEVNRIKSLFTEERLYGNLITEKEVVDDGDPFSAKSIRNRRKADKKSNKSNNDTTKKDDNVRLKTCNESLKNYHKSFFAIDPEKRGNVMEIVGDEMKYKTNLELCIKDYKDKLNVPNFAGMDDDEMLDMLVVMLDPKGNQDERMKYKNTTVKDSVLQVKPTTTITTKKPENITDESGVVWGTVQIIKNTENEFVIKTGSKTRVESGMSFRDSIIKQTKFIPSLIKSIKKINTSLNPVDYKNLKILKARGDTGQTIKIKVV